MSKGLGKRWIIDNAKQVREEGKVVHNGKPVYAPRYYIRKIWSKEKLIEKYNIAITNKHEEVRYEMAVRRISSTDPLYKERREFLVQKVENLTKKLSESKKTKFHHTASPEQLFERYKAFMISTMKSQSTKLDSRKLIIDQLETMFVNLNLETLEHPRNMGPPPI
ncbi:MAG: hypothetical protein LBS15_03160 [Endomicrobium sp.]|jgi:midasin (ATPase involved in ribosome maturation)|nr:hypothetical protein [Endomicrobium sp.]